MAKNAAGKPPRKTRRTAQPVDKTVPNPILWAAVKKEVRGDFTRVQILNENEAIIRNKGRGSRRRS